MMAESIFFNRRQQSSIAEILGVAEALAGNYFEIDLDDFVRFPYDLMTLANLRGMEKTREALAQVCKYEYFKKKPVPKGKEFYRICLQDDKILRTVKTEFSLSLEPLLLYIITHELVHVVRFSIDPKKFHLHSREKNIEEREVHRMTYNCLKLFKDPQVEDLLERYRPWWDLKVSDWEISPLTNMAGMPNFLSV